MAKNDIFTIEELDRTIFELIRNEVVSQGYLPNITDYANETDWKAARVSYGASLIDVFGVGSAESRDEKIVHRIVINRSGTQQGSVGLFGILFTDKVSDGFPINKSFRTLEHTVNIGYDIYCVTNSVQFERVMVDIIQKVLHFIKYFNPFFDTGEGYIFDIERKFLLKWGGTSDASDTDFRCTRLSYTIVDVLIGFVDVVDNNIPILETVSFYLYSGSSMEDMGEPTLITTTQESFGCNYRVTIDSPTALTHVIGEIIYQKGAGFGTLMSFLYDTGSDVDAVSELRRFCIDLGSQGYIVTYSYIDDGGGGMSQFTINILNSNTVFVSFITKSKLGVPSIRLFISSCD